MKEPIPEPVSKIKLFVIVGEVFVFQQIPRDITCDPPVFVIFPPDIADDIVIVEIGEVVSVGKIVEKLISAP